MSGESRKYVAELVGTFVLVLGGVGTAVLAGELVGALGVALAFGLALLAMIYVIGPVSGCHVNPAVTLGLMLSRKIEPRLAGGYVVAQVVGAILAAGLIWIVAAGIPGGYDPGAAGLGANGYADHSPAGYSLFAGLTTEIVLTALLVLTVLGATHRSSPVGFAGVAIGLVLVLIHLVSIPVTNTSVNPARSIGPAVFVGGWAMTQLWLFVVGPLIGGALGALVYRGIHVVEEEITAAEAERALPDEQAERIAT
jgi:aquaporin Z